MPLCLIVYSLCWKISFTVMENRLKNQAEGFVWHKNRGWDREGGAEG